MDNRVEISGVSFILSGCKSMKRKNFDTLYGDISVNPRGNFAVKRPRFDAEGLDRVWTTLQAELDKKFNRNSKPEPKKKKVRKRNKK